MVDEYEVSKETVGSCGYSKREWCDKRYRGMKYYGVFEGIRIRFVLGKHKGQCRNREIVVVGEWKMVVTGDGVVRTELQWHSGGPRTKDMELFLKASAMWQSEEEISPGWNSIFQKILKSRAIILFLLSQKQVQIERWRTLAKIIHLEIKGADLKNWGMWKKPDSSLLPERIQLIWFHLCHFFKKNLLTNL